MILERIVQQINSLITSLLSCLFFSCLLKLPPKIVDHPDKCVSQIAASPHQTSEAVNMWPWAVNTTFLPQIGNSFLFFSKNEDFVL